MEAFLPFDSSILLWIQSNLRTDALTPIVSFITHLGDKGLFWIVLSLILIAIPRTRRIGVTSACAMIIGLVVTNLIIKNWVARIRPYEIIEGLECLVGKEKDFSFPSGHTTNSLACACVIFSMAPKKWGVPALTLAILISLSRLYVGVHYPTDIIGGVIIGVGSAWLALYLTPRIVRRLPKKARIALGFSKKKRRSTGTAEEQR